MQRAREWQREVLAGNVVNPAITNATPVKEKEANGTSGAKEKEHRSGSGFGKQIKSAVRSITGKSPSSEPEEIASASTSPPGGSTPKSQSLASSQASLSSSPSDPTPDGASTPTTGTTGATPPSNTSLPTATRRVLYTANAGDARAVLSRRHSTAVRLTYDHKGSDANEARRIKEAGGFVMNNRVNGVLAVTRSLGDSAMKEFVVGSPYTTETVLGEEDDLLIIACDGVSPVLSLASSTSFSLLA